MAKDKIFDKKVESVKDFEFNEQVANVFDDMVSRSVPIYNEIHKIINDISRRYLPDQAIVYDLGCSTGSTILHVFETLKANNKSAYFYGIDNSQSMLEKCQEKLSNNKVNNYELILESLEDVHFKECDMVIMNYTLQFLSKEKRLELVEKIYLALRPGGIFILSEKIESSIPIINERLIELYYDFKRRNGYSELEISQKREALENVLKPLTPKEQIQMLNKAGFEQSELVFRWYNFASYLAIK